MLEKTEFRHSKVQVKKDPHLRRGTVVELRPRRTVEETGSQLETVKRKNLLLSKIGEDRIPSNKKRVDNQELPKKPYAKDCKFGETEIVNLVIKENYKATGQFDLNTRRIRSIHCFFDTRARPYLLGEVFFALD